MVNLYAHCKGNPVIYCDSSGMAGILDEWAKEYDASLVFKLL